MHGIRSSITFMSLFVGRVVCVCVFGCVQQTRDARGSHRHTHRPSEPVDRHNTSGNVINIHEYFIYEWTEYVFMRYICMRGTFACSYPEKNNRAQQQQTTNNINTEEMNKKNCDKSFSCEGCKEMVRWQPYEPEKRDVHKCKCENNTNARCAIYILFCNRAYIIIEYSYILFQFKMDLELNTIPMGRSYWNSRGNSIWIAARGSGRSTTVNHTFHTNIFGECKHRVNQQLIWLFYIRIWPPWVDKLNLLLIPF